MLLYARGLNSQIDSPARWLYITLVLGLLFVAGQYVAWSQLSARGLYLATNPSSSFFYFLTATHALHVLGGLGGLIYVIRKLSKSVLRRSRWLRPRVTGISWAFFGCICSYCFG